MMYLVVVSYANGDVKYHGPFKSKNKAVLFSVQYPETLTKKVARCFVQSIVPAPIAYE